MPTTRRITLRIPHALAAKLEATAKALDTTPNQVAVDVLRDADLSKVKKRGPRQVTSERKKLCVWIAKRPGCLVADIREGLPWKRSRGLLAVDLKRLKEAGYLKATGSSHTSRYFRTRKKLPQVLRLP